MLDYLALKLMGLKHHKSKPNKSFNKMLKKEYRVRNAEFQL